MLSAKYKELLVKFNEAKSNLNMHLESINTLKAQLVKEKEAYEKEINAHAKYLNEVLDANEKRKSFDIFSKIELGAKVHKHSVELQNSSIINLIQSINVAEENKKEYAKKWISDNSIAITEFYDQLKTQNISVRNIIFSHYKQNNSPSLANEYLDQDLIPNQNFQCDTACTLTSNSYLTICQMSNVIYIANKAITHIGYVLCSLKEIKQINSMSTQFTSLLLPAIQKIQLNLINIPKDSAYYEFYTSLIQKLEQIHSNVSNSTESISLFANLEKQVNIDYTATHNIIKDCNKIPSLISYMVELSCRKSSTLSIMPISYNIRQCATLFTNSKPQSSRCSLLFI
jgi:hypothetical protein